MSDENLKPLECFKAYLASGYAPQWAMQPADLHGFLLGLAIAGPVAEEDWLPLVWSGETPQFTSEAEAWNVTYDLLDFEAQVRASLGSYRILTTAMLPHVGGGQYHVADWSEGFMQAIALNPEPWQRALDAAEHSLTTVLAGCYDNHDEANCGLITAEGLEDVNYHLRHLTRLMRTAPSHVSARAA